jgi:hypothetical protein
MTCQVSGKLFLMYITLAIIASTWTVDNNAEFWSWLTNNMSFSSLSMNTHVVLVLANLVRFSLVFYEEM